MPNTLQKLFSSPSFEDQKRADQAKLLNRFWLFAFFTALVLCVISFLLGSVRVGFFLLIMLLYLLSNKVLLQLKRYVLAVWAFLIWVTLINFMFGGLFPEFPIFIVTLPFLLVSARLLLDFKAALLTLIVNLIGYVGFIQPFWVADFIEFGPVIAILISSILVVVMIDAFVRFKEKHLEESEQHSTQLEQEYHGSVEELSRAKEALMREHQALVALETKAGQEPDQEDAHLYHPITGVLTEEAVIDILSHEISRTRRYQRPLALLCARVDNYEMLVSEFEIDIDKVLTSINDAFLETLRREDRVGHRGKDGFYIILPETGRYASYVVGERLRHLVEVMALPYLDEDVRLSVSVGITAFQDQSKMTAERFISQAEEAVEAARSRGGNWTVSWHDLSHSNF